MSDVEHHYNNDFEEAACNLSISYVEESQLNGNQPESTKLEKDVFGPDVLGNEGYECNVSENENLEQNSSKEGTQEQNMFEVEAEGQSDSDAEEQIIYESGEESEEGYALEVDPNVKNASDSDVELEEGNKSEENKHKCDNCKQEPPKLVIHRVDEPSILLWVLEERLPLSAMMYNQVQQWPNFKDELKFYSVGGKLNSDIWIISNNIRHDYQGNFSISTPMDMAASKKEIPYEVLECIATTPLFNWTNMGHTMFLNTTQAVTNMLVDIAANKYGNLTQVRPCNMFTMEKRPVNLAIPNIFHDALIRKLNSANSEGDFIVKNWIHSKPGTELDVPNCLDKNPSAGVFVDGKCVSGVYTPATGGLTGLFTSKEHRGKGFSQIALLFAANECVMNGMFPCVTVEMQNPKKTVSFHEWLGFKRVALVSNIIITKFEKDSE